MPWVPGKAADKDRARHDERPARYVCDWPGCRNVAEQVMACVKELGASAAFCTEHAIGAGPGQGDMKPA